MTSQMLDLGSSIARPLAGLSEPEDTLWRNSERRWLHNGAEAGAKVPRMYRAFLETGKTIMRLSPIDIDVSNYCDEDVCSRCSCLRRPASSGPVRPVPRSHTSHQSWKSLRATSLLCSTTRPLNHGWKRPTCVALRSCHAWIWVSAWILPVSPAEGDGLMRLAECRQRHHEAGLRQYWCQCCVSIALLRETHNSD